MASRKQHKIARDADKSRPQRQQPSRNNTLNDNLPMEGLPRTEHIPTTSTESISVPQPENLNIICSTSLNPTTTRGLVPPSQSELNLSSGRTHSFKMVPQDSLSKNERFATIPLPCTTKSEENQSGSSVLRSSFAHIRGTVQTDQGKLKSQPHPRVCQRTVSDSTTTTAPIKRTTSDKIRTRTVLEPSRIMITARPKPESNLITKSCYFPDIINTRASSKKPSGNQTTEKKNFLPRPSKIPVPSSSCNFPDNNPVTRAKTNSSGTTIKKHNLPVVTCSTRGVRIICKGSQISTCPPCFPSFQHGARMSRNLSCTSSVLTGGSIMSSTRVTDTSTRTHVTTTKSNPTTLPPRLSPLVTNSSTTPRATTYVVDSIKGPLFSLSVSSPQRVMLRPRNKTETETVSAESISCEPSANLLSGNMPIKPNLVPTGLPGRSLDPIMLNPRRIVTTEISSSNASTRETLAPPNLSPGDMLLNKDKKPAKLLRKPMDPIVLNPRRVLMTEFPTPDASTTEVVAPTNFSILDMPIKSLKLLKKPMDPIVLNPRRFVMTNIPSPASTRVSSGDMPINPDMLSPRLVRRNTEVSSSGTRPREFLATTNLSSEDTNLVPTSRPMEPIVLNPRRLKMVQIPLTDASTTEAIPANNLSSEVMSTNPNIVPTIPRRFKVVDIPSLEPSQAIAPTNTSPADMPINTDRVPPRVLNRPSRGAVPRRRREPSSQDPILPNPCFPIRQHPILQNEYHSRKVTLSQENIPHFVSRPNPVLLHERLTDCDSPRIPLRESTLNRDTSRTGHEITRIISIKNPQTHEIQEYWVRRNIEMLSEVAGLTQVTTASPTPANITTASHASVTGTTTFRAPNRAPLRSVLVGKIMKVAHPRKKKKLKKIKRKQTNSVDRLSSSSEEAPQQSAMKSTHSKISAVRLRPKQSRRRDNSVSSDYPTWKDDNVSQVSSRAGSELISSEGEANNDIELPEQSAQERLESYLSSAHRYGGRHDGGESETD